MNGQFIPQDDLALIENHCRSIASDLENKTILLTGATGFFGKWLLLALTHLNKTLSLNLKVYAMSRNPSAFLNQFPIFKEIAGLTFFKSDILSPILPDTQIDFVIHAATESSSSLGIDQPGLMFSTIVNGTQLLFNALKGRNTKRFLLTSSGAVYGSQPFQLSHIPESYLGAPDPTIPINAYGEGKRAAELLGVIMAKELDLSFTSARCFSFVGPYLPLKGHFAIGNFIYDALKKRPIEVSGDGTPCRSYLYAADMTIWLLHLLLRGKNGKAYNVGSDQAISIQMLANLVAKLNDNQSLVLVKGTPPENISPSRYIPSIETANAELKLTVYTDLEASILKTLNWNRLNGISD